MIGLVVFLVALVGAYAQFPTDCGRSAVRQNLDSRIVGGQEAKPNSWPWQISLRAYNQHTCGGSIIHKNYVLTAAHCTDGYPVSAFSIHAGRHYETGTCSTEQAHAGSTLRMWQHESYNPTTIHNDVTLFRVSKAFTFDNYVRPVCVPTNELTKSGTQMWATGWGEVQNTGNQGKLKQTMLPYVDRATCQRNYYGSGITNAMICAGTRPGDNVCMGDSGGPLVSQVSGKWEIYGVSSWVGDSNCYYGGPGVFASVPVFRNWISSKIYQAEAEEELIAQRNFRPIPAGVAFRKMHGIEVKEQPIEIVPVQE